MLRLVARYADIWNRDFDGVTPGYEPYSAADLEASQLKVDTACIEIGRDPATLARTVGVWVELPDQPSRGWNAVTGAPNEIAAGLRRYAAAGFSEVQVWPQTLSVASVESFAPVLELLRADADANGGAS